jgi:DNA polymerase III subunit epsilon
VRRGWGRPNPAQFSLFDPAAGSTAPPSTGRAPWSDGELLGFDLETTGVDRLADVPVSLAFVSVKSGITVDRSVVLVDPGRPIPLEATAVHGITTERARREGIALIDAVEFIGNELVSTSRRGVPVVGIKLDYDLTIVDVLCRAIDGRGLRERGWTGPALDVLVLDRHLDPYRVGRRTLVDLCAVYGVTLARAHSAESDAEAAVAVLLAMSRSYPELMASPLHALHALQVESQRSWAVAFDTWLRADGLGGLDPSEGRWPIASPVDSGVGAA